MDKTYTGIIYKLCSSNTTDVYIGSTTQKLKTRFYEHNKKFKLYNKGKYHFVTSFLIIEKLNSYIIEIEKVVGTKRQILERERYYIENTENSINKNIPTRTHKQYYSENKEWIKMKHSTPNICLICSGQYTYANKSSHEKTKKHLSFLN
jgi:hypothetical protein